MCEETGKEKSKRIDLMLENMLKDNPGKKHSVDEIAEYIGAERRMVFYIQEEALKKALKAAERILNEEGA